MILQSEVLERVSTGNRGRSSSRGYSAGIVTGHKVNGRDYTSDAVYFGRVAGSSDSSEAEMLHLRYPRGAAVTVFHSPAWPQTKETVASSRNPESRIWGHSGLALRKPSLTTGHRRVPPRRQNPGTRRLRHHRLASGHSAASPWPKREIVAAREETRI